MLDCLETDCYPDPNLNILTVDFAFFISEYYSQESVMQTDDTDDSIQDQEETNRSDSIRYWLLNAKPSIWSFHQLSVGECQSYDLYNSEGNKRRIFQNFLDARVGDKVIGYESTPIKQIVALAEVARENDGNTIVFRKIEGLTYPIDLQTIRVRY